MLILAKRRSARGNHAIAHYRERIRQSGARGEFALSETLRAIIVQEHEIDLRDSLGMSAPAVKGLPNLAAPSDPAQPE